MKEMRLFEAVGELDDDLLADAEEFLENTTTARKKPGPWVRWGGLAACFAVAVCAFWAGSPRGEQGRPQQEATPPADLQQNAVPPSEIIRSTPNVDRPAIESEPLTRPIIQMNFNQLEEAPSSGETYGMYLGGENRVPMTWEEMMDHYGVTLPVEEVLPDLTAVGPKDDRDYGWGVYRTNGIVYHDDNVFVFRSADEVRSVSVRMATGTTGAYSTFTIEELGDSLAFTTIDGWELALFQYKSWEGDDYYYVEFCQNSIRYRVRGKNLVDQEFAAVLESLLEERSGCTPGEPRTFVGEYDGGIGLETLMSRNPDESMTVEKRSWIGFLHMKLGEGEAYTSLTLELPSEELEKFSDLSLGDRVAVTFIGEPATIGTVWPQQLVSLERVGE